MQVNRINSAPSFGAKFFYTEPLYDVAKYAVERGKFPALNQARKNIDNAYLTTRLAMYICYTGEYPTVIFSRYKPRKSVPVAFNFNDYELVAQTEFISHKKMNPLKFGLETLIKLGNNAPNNKMYRKVVVER